MKPLTSRQIARLRFAAKCEERSTTCPLVRSYAAPLVKRGLLREELYMHEVSEWGKVVRRLPTYSITKLGREALAKHEATRER